MTVEVTQEDRDLLEAISGGFMEWRPKAKTERLEMIARHRIASTRAAAERIAELEGALEPFVSGACHTMVFLQSREKMHSCGIDLYREDVERARTALQHKEPKP